MNARERSALADNETPRPPDRPAVRWPVDVLGLSFNDLSDVLNELDQRLALIEVNQVPVTSKERLSA